MASSYRIPRPFGEVTYWRLYNRNQDADRSSARVYEKYFNGDKGVEVTTVYTTTASYVRRTTYELTSENESIGPTVKEGEWIQIGDDKDWAIARVVGVSITTNNGFTSHVFVEEPSSIKMDMAWRNAKVGTLKVIKASVKGDWPWQGNPLKLEERDDGNPSDDNDWRFEIRTIESYGQTDDPNQGEATLVQSAGWAMIKAAQKALRLAVRDITSDLQRQYDREVQQKFEAYITGLQSKLSREYQKMFYPRNSDASSSSNTSGWVLLRPAENTANGKRIKLQTTENEIIAVQRGDGTVSGKGDTEFEVVAGSLDIMTSDNKVVESIRKDPPNITLEDLDSRVFELGMSEPQLELPSKETRIRLSAVQNEDSTLLGVDQPVQPFEHDLHVAAVEDFNAELKAVVDMIYSFLFGTMKAPSKKEVLSAFKSERISPISTEYTRLMPDPIHLQYPRSDRTQLLSFSYSSKMNAVNDYSPSVDPDAVEVGTCATLVWKPAVLAASQNQRMEKNTAYRFLLNQIPFVSPHEAVYGLKEKCVKEQVDTLKKTFKDRYVLEQCKNDYSPSYSPLVLEYQTLVTESTGASTDETIWCLGTAPSITMEALEVTLLVLQRMLEKTSKDGENSMKAIKEREEEYGVDAYPYGFTTNQTCDVPAVRIGDVDGFRDVPNFRDWARKEKQYTDSFFDIDKIESAPVGNVRHTPWSGIYARTKDVLKSDRLLVQYC